MIRIDHRFETTATAARFREALCTSEGVKGWWSRDCDIAGHVGGVHELRFQKGDRQVTMRFRVDVIGNERVAWTCTENGNPVWVGTTLEWRLKEGQLYFSHAGFAEDRSPPYKMTADGWPAFMGSLKSWLGGGKGSPS